MLISLNGLDTTGKTTNIDWLKEDLSDRIIEIPRLVNFDPRWGKQDSSGREIGSPEFWFANDNVDDFIDIYLTSLQKMLIYSNSVKDNNPSKLILQDRGFANLYSGLIATIRSKTNKSSKEAKELLNNYCIENEINFPTPNEDISILLYTELSREDNVKETLDRMHLMDPNIKDRKAFLEVYSKYQMYLNEEMDISLIDNFFTDIIPARDSILNVQNSIRTKINNYSKTGQKVPLLCQNVSNIVGIGGLTESGKSSCGEIIDNDFKGMRLKLYYFINVIELQTKKHHSTMNMADLSRKYAFEFNRFSNLHYYNPLYAIDSLRDLEFAKELKKAFGSKFTIAYVECSRSLAAKRNAVRLGCSIKDAYDDIKKRDLSKVATGADKVIEIADCVINNNYGMEDFKKSISNLLENEKMSKRKRVNSRAILLSGKNKLVLMHRIKNGQEYYVTPGGGVEGIEKPDEALIREIKEEAGIPIDPQSLKEPILIESQNTKDYFFFCREDRSQNRTEPTGPEISKSTKDNYYEIVECDINSLAELNIVPPQVRNMIDAYVSKIDVKKNNKLTTISNISNYKENIDKNRKISSVLSSLIERKR